MFGSDGWVVDRLLYGRSLGYRNTYQLAASPRPLYRLPKLIHTYSPLTLPLASAESLNFPSRRKLRTHLYPIHPRSALFYRRCDPIGRVLWDLPSEYYPFLHARFVCVLVCFYIDGLPFLGFVPVLNPSPEC
jgi:hypothetical protein